MDIYSLIIKHVISTPRERAEQRVTGDIAEMFRRGCVLHSPAFYVKKNHDTNPQPRVVLLFCTRALKKTFAAQTAVVKV